MIEVKANFTGGLNLDDALYNVQNNQYIDALNVTRDAIQGSNDMPFTNIVGNQLVPTNYLQFTSTLIPGRTTDIVEVLFTGDLVLGTINITIDDISIGRTDIIIDNVAAFGTIEQLVNYLNNIATPFPGVSYFVQSNNILAISYFNATYSNVTVTLTNQSIASRKVCIGAYPNTIRNTVIYFLWDENGYHLILQYNNATRTITKILMSRTDSGMIDILGFQELNKITSVNIYNRNIAIGEGDLLYFLDSQGRPTGLDILRFQNGEYIPITRDIIDVAKNVPLFPPVCLYGNETSKTTNSLRNRLFRFKYRYVYDNNELSTCSPISEVPLPFNILDDTYNNIISNNNKIDLSFYTGDKTVKNVELLMSYVNKTNDWSDFSLIHSVDKANLTGLTGILGLSTFPGFPNITIASIVFNGLIFPWTTIEISMTRLSPLGIVPLAAYTVVSGDTINSIVNNLYTQLLTLPAGTFGFVATNGGNTLSFSYNNTVYSIVQSQIVIVNSITNFDNANIQYTFYNDGTYPVIDVNESIQLYDYVPTNANAQEMPNGNVLMYGGITEGYDKLQHTNVVNNILTREVLNINYGNLTSLFRLGRDGYSYSVTFFGVPLAGTVITIYVNSTSGVIIGSQYTTVVDNESIASIVFQLAQNFLVRGTGGTGGTYWTSTYVVCVLPSNTYSSTTIVQPTSSAIANSIPTFLFSTSRKLGIAYFDQKGKTNGIVYSGNIDFPAYAENPTSHKVLLPYINTKIYHKPPEWAYSYGFYLTKESTQFLYWETADVKWGTNPVLASADYIYFDVTNISKNAIQSPTTATVLSYTFQDGDRVRLIRRPSDDTFFNDTYDAEVLGQVIDPKIDGANISKGIFIKIKAFAPFNTVNYTSKNFIIQLYRNLQTQPSGNNEVYYEFGQQYPIGDATLDTRFHIGVVTSQDYGSNTPAEFNFYNGDVYYRRRTITLDNETLSGSATYATLDRNFIDNYTSAVNSINGRTSIIDTNARKAYYSTLVRFSGAYQPDTNINGLNRFYALNFDQYDYTYGDIMRLKTRDRFVRVFQKLKVGQVPLYHQILKEQNKESLVVSDRLLNPIQYYVGDLGIGDHPESLASYNFADYFVSNIKGIIARVSNDGVKFLSIDRKVDSWAWDHISRRGGDYKIYGCFDQILGNYIIALEQTPTDPAYTLLYGENENTFDSFLSYHPEMMVNLGVLYITFKDGALYTHDATYYNNFYGTQYDSSVTFVFNQMPADRKTFTNISEVASQIWEVPEMKTDIVNPSGGQMVSYLITSDFETLEGGFEAAILKDINSPGGIIDGDTMKGRVMTVKFNAQSPSSLVSLNLVSLKYINSPLNNR
jgi:hypothetical protein